MPDIDPKPKCVMVVEDQYFIRLMLVEGLTDAGFDVTAAASGDEALRVLQAGSSAFDLLITDIQMPGEADGNAVGAYAKSRQPGLPVIYASGRRDTLTNTLNPEDAFVPKPFGIREIISIYENLPSTRPPRSA